MLRDICIGTIAPGADLASSSGWGVTTRCGGVGGGESGIYGISRKLKHSSRRLFWTILQNYSYCKWNNNDLAVQAYKGMGSTEYKGCS